MAKTMHGQIIKAIATFLVALSAVATAPLATAAGEVAAITALTKYGCAQSGTDIDWTMSGTPGVTYLVNMVVNANGQTVMNEDDGTFDGSTSDNYSAYYSNSYGPAVNAWPLPPNTIMEIRMVMRLDSTQEMVSTGVMRLNCTTGEILANYTESASAPMVPTLGEWAMLLTSLLLAASAGVALRGRR